MKHPRLTEHMKERYEIHLSNYKKALKDCVDTTLAGFCRDNDIDIRSFTSWLCRHKKLTPLDIRNEARKSAGMKPVVGRGKLQYERHLQAYKEMLAIDLDYALSQYCTDAGISAHAFHHWIMRRGINVEKIKEDVCISLGINPNTAKKAVRYQKTTDRKPTEPTLFRKALAGYKKMLETDHELSLKKYCRAKGYAYKPLLHWMYEIGIKPADIKAFVVDRQKLPKDSRRVFIQFKPNGGVQSDILNGVRISLPDGTQVDVECCSVVSLCSFVNIYSKQNEK